MKETTIRVTPNDSYFINATIGKYLDMLEY
jgi:hypothetical protein